MIRFFSGLFLLSLTLSLVSCNLFQKEDKEAESEEGLKPVTNSDEYDINDYDDSPSEDPFDEADIDDLFADEEEEETVPSKPPTRPESYEPTDKELDGPTSQTTSFGGEEYLVVAGAYSTLANAEEMVRQLKDRGYSGAEVVHFSAGAYHTVIAGRYTSYSKADQVAGEVRNTFGVEAYAHKKRYSK